jgi:hypothetical protein
VLILILVLSGGSNFKKVKEGMTAKEVTDLLGEPQQGDVKFVAMWTYPKKSTPETVKETLTVSFRDGKVAKADIIDVDKLRKEMGKAFK